MRKFTKEKKIEAERLFHEGFSLSKMEALVGISRKQIAKYFDEIGLRKIDYVGNRFGLKEAQEMKKLVDNKIPYVEIGKKFNCSHTLIFNALKKYGLYEKQNKFGDIDDPETRKRVVDEYLLNRRQDSIAKEFHFSTTNVRKILVEEGIKIRTAKHGEKMGDKIQYLYENSGLSIKSIAKKLNIERKVIDRFKEERDFERKVPVKVKTKSSKGKTRMESLISRYGEKEAEIRFKKSQKLYSEATSGRNNPMYGKPSPMGSGYGIKGWHKGRFFRSLRELSFILNYIDRFNLKNESLEKHIYRIPYIDPMGIDKTYAGDFLINDKFFVEIKPKKLWESPSVKAKAEAGIKFCKEQGWKYKLIDPVVKNDQVVKEYLAGNIKFNEKSLEKFLEFNDLKSSQE